MAIIRNRVGELVAARAAKRGEQVNVMNVAYDLRVTWVVARNWMAGYVTRIDLPILLRWCEYLECEPCDILVLDRSESERE